MDMAKVKLTQISQHGDLMDRYGASIRILGQRELVKPDVLEAIDKAVEMTSQNGSAVLNICFPYTSRDEMTTAVRRTVDEWSKPLPEKRGGSPFKKDRIAQNIRNQHQSPCKGPQQIHPTTPKANLSPSSSTTSLSSNADSLNGTPSPLSSTTTLQHPASPPLLAADFKEPLLTRPSNHTTRTFNHSTFYPSPEAITSSTLTSHMFTADNPPLDLLIRTSSVYRLSDFMLWQCHQNTEITFLDVLWPEFDLWTFLPVLWEWQWRQKKSRAEDPVGKTIKGRSMSNSKIRADRKKAVSELMTEGLD